MFGIGVSIKEVEHEALYRAASELSSSLFRYVNKDIDDAIRLMQKGIATKYLTGVKDQEIIFKKLLQNFFEATLEILTKLFRLSRRLRGLEIENFEKTIIQMWKNYGSIIPLAHLFNLISGQPVSKSPRQENIRFLTGNVCEPRYRAYLFAKNYPTLQYYYDSYNKFFILESDDPESHKERTSLLNQLYDGMSKFHPEVTEFLASMYNFLFGSDQVQDILNDFNFFIFLKIRFWVARDDAVEIFQAIFGTHEAFRIELKYSGIITESETVEQALQRLKHYMIMLTDSDLFPHLRRDKTENEDNIGSISHALAKISRLRQTKINLESILLKKRFIRGLSLAERDIFFEGLTSGQNFHQYTAMKAQELGIQVDVSSLDNMALENLYQKMFREDPITTMIKAVQDDNTPIESEKNFSGHESTVKYERIVNMLVRGRGERIKEVFGNSLKLRALFNGLSDEELDNISQILFKTSQSTKDEVLQEFLVIMSDKDKFTSDGTDLKDITKKKEALKQLKEFNQAIIRYALSPAFISYDLAIDMIYWTKEHVNDLFIALDSKDAFLQNQGKKAIYSLAKEACSIFPVMRKNSHLSVAFLSSMITKEKAFSEILHEIKQESLLIETYSGLTCPLPQQCGFWFIANEIWVRHISREVREKKKSQAQKTIQKLSLDEKARRAYQIAENALVKYTYSLHSKQGVSLLTISHEDAFFEFLKFLRQHGAKELLETEFSIAGDTSDLNMGSIRLRDAVLQIIHSDYSNKFIPVLKEIELSAPMSEDEILNIAAKGLDLFNESMIHALSGDVFLNSSYLESIQHFCSRNQIWFTRLRNEKDRRVNLEKIIITMGQEFLTLINEGEKIKQYSYVKDLLSSIFEVGVLRWIRTLVEDWSDENLENFGRYLWGKGIKKNSFTVLLNHLLKGDSAEIGTENWRRYGERCRYILRRIGRTCKIVLLP